MSDADAPDREPRIALSSVRSVILARNWMDKLVAVESIVREIGDEADITVADRLAELAEQIGEDIDQHRVR